MVSLLWTLVLDLGSKADKYDFLRVRSPDTDSDRYHCCGLWFWTWDQKQISIDFLRVRSPDTDSDSRKALENTQPRRPDPPICTEPPSHNIHIKVQYVMMVQQKQNRLQYIRMVDNDMIQGALCPRPVCMLSSKKLLALLPS
jgi:hypothetical protein